MCSSLFRVVGFVALACCAAQACARDAVFAYRDGDDSILLTNLQETGRTALFTVALFRDDDAPARLQSTGPRMAPPDVARLVDTIAPSSGLEPQLLLAVISAESGFRAKAVSPKGAQGLMQLMPTTARRLGVTDPFDPEQNVRGGARYPTELLRMFNDDMRLAPGDATIAADWPGGFFCPCHGSKFDLAGRVYEGSPASANLSIPPYSFEGDNKLVIGLDPAPAQGSA